MTEEEQQSEQQSVLQTEHPLDKRSAIAGLCIGVILGSAVAFVVGEQIGSREEAAKYAAMIPSHPMPSSSVPRPRPNASADPTTEAKPSFAQQGEDLVLIQMLQWLNIRRPVYIDIGAHHPVINSNTFLLYQLGGHGVLVEPNPFYAEKLRKMRPRDVTVEVGIGVTDQREADYYIMEGDGQLNTFSKEQVAALGEVHKIKVKETIKRPLVNINKVLDENLKDGHLDVLSIDIEGMDLEVLQTLDWKKWHPALICVETSSPRTGAVETEILEFLATKGYTVRGGSFVNTVFLSNEAHRKRLEQIVPDAGARLDSGK